MRWLLALVLIPVVSLSAEDYLTEGVDSGRTGWLKNEKVFTTTNVGTMKLLWKVKVNSTPRQMHNLFAPLTVSGVTTPRGARELAVFAGISDQLYAVDVATGETIWEKKFDSIYPSVTTGVGQHVVPGRADRGTGHHDDSDAGQIHDVRAVVGWPSSYARRRDGRRCRASGEIRRTQRQAVRVESLQRRHLHVHGPGMRGQYERISLLRPRHEEVEHLCAGRRRHVGPPRCRDRSGRPRLHGHRRCAVRRRDKQPGHRGRCGEARCQQTIAVCRLLRSVERQLAVPARPRPERHTDGLRLSRAEVSRRDEQGMPLVAARSRRPGRSGQSHARCRRRRCSATTRRRSTAKASGARWPPGRTPRGVNGSSCRSTDRSVARSKHRSSMRAR